MRWLTYVKYPTPSGITVPPTIVSSGAYANVPAEPPLMPEAGTVVAVPESYSMTSHTTSTTPPATLMLIVKGTAVFSAPPERLRACQKEALEPFGGFALMYGVYAELVDESETSTCGVNAWPVELALTDDHTTPTVEAEVVVVGNPHISTEMIRTAWAIPRATELLVVHIMPNESHNEYAWIGVSTAAVFVKRRRWMKRVFGLNGGGRTIRICLFCCFDMVVDLPCGELLAR